MDGQSKRYVSRGACYTGAYCTGYNTIATPVGGDGCPLAVLVTPRAVKADTGAKRTECNPGATPVGSAGCLQAVPATPRAGRAEYKRNPPKDCGVEATG
jgi:hypothetical protein